jgi:hypothetical protein
MDDMDVIRFVAMDTISKAEYHGPEDYESE